MCLWPTIDTVSITQSRLQVSITSGSASVWALPRQGYACLCHVTAMARVLSWREIHAWQSPSNPTGGNSKNVFPCFTFLCCELPPPTRIYYQVCMFRFPRLCMFNLLRRSVFPLPLLLRFPFVLLLCPHLASCSWVTRFIKRFYRYVRDSYRHPEVSIGMDLAQWWRNSSFLTHSVSFLTP